MKAIKAIRDPEAFQLLADETRRKMIYLLRVKEMTVGQLAEELDLTPQAVYHHIKKLLKGEFVEVTREERIGHLIESYYRATAEMFSLSHGRATAKDLRSRKLAEEQVKTALETLEKVGFNLEYDERKVSELVEAETKLEECCKDIDKIENAIYEMSELDLLTKNDVTELARLLLMSDKEFNEQQTRERKFRELLTSMVKHRKSIAHAQKLQVENVKAKVSN